MLRQAADREGATTVYVAGSITLTVSLSRVGHVDAGWRRPATSGTAARAVRGVDVVRVQQRRDAAGDRDGGRRCRRRGAAGVDGGRVRARCGRPVAGRGRGCRAGRAAPGGPGPGCGDRAGAGDRQGERQREQPAGGRSGGGARADLRASASGRRVGPARAGRRGVRSVAGAGEQPGGGDRLQPAVGEPGRISGSAVTVPAWPRCRLTMRPAGPRRASGHDGAGPRVLVVEAGPPKPSSRS